MLGKNIIFLWVLCHCFSAHSTDQCVSGTAEEEDKELSAEISKLTRAVKGKEDTKPYIDSLIEVALNTPYSTLQFIQKTLFSLKHHRLNLTQIQADQLLSFVDLLESFQAESLKRGMLLPHRLPTTDKKTRDGLEGKILELIKPGGG